jgi:hypothetical protein
MTADFRRVRSRVPSRVWSSGRGGVRPLGVWFCLSGLLALALLAPGLSGVAAEAGTGEPPQSAPAAADVCNIETSDRVVAIGDVHGAYASFVDILKRAGLIDNRSRWSGGRTTLVQTGDVLHRGPDSRKVLDLLMQLEPQAAAAGGRVIALLGNHEVMRMMRDLRYVSPAEYAAFRSAGAEAYREVFWGRLLDQAPARAVAAGKPFDERELRKQFLEQVPLGYVEMQIAFEPEGPYGRWLRTHAAVARINGVIFVHGGINPGLASKGCEGINADVRRELDDLPDPDDPRAADTLVAGSDGPLWYRDLALDDTLIDEEDVDQILERLDARAMVVGHTPTENGRMRTRFGNRVIQIDTGMLDGTFYPGGRPSALEMRGDTLTAIYADRRDALATLVPMPVLTR